MKQIPKGYKHTALGILPQDWEVVRLGDIGIFLKGSGISKENLSDSGIACIRYGELYTTYKEVINYVYCKTDIPIQGLVLSKKNDILIPTSGETAIDIATASCILLDGVAIGGDTNIVRTEQNGIYLAYCLNNMMKNRIASLAQGATVIHLYANHLKTLEIPLPPIKEQEKIAQILNTWDSYIDNLEKLIEAKQRYKKGLMQRLLTPPQEFCHSEGSEVTEESKNIYIKVIKDSSFAMQIQNDGDISPTAQYDKGNTQYEKGGKRQPYGDIQPLRFKEFSGTWQEVKLGDIAKIYQSKTIQQSDFCDDGFLVYGANGVIGKYHLYNHELEQVIIACRGNSCGAVNFTKPKSWITGNAMVINFDNFSNIVKKFMYFLFMNTDFSYLISGSGQPQITSQIKNHIVNLPTLQEQEKIARVLSLCDEEIQTLKKMLESRKKQKRGLMQNLLNGKVRVKV